MAVAGVVVAADAAAVVVVEIAAAAAAVGTAADKTAGRKIESRGLRIAAFYITVSFSIWALVSLGRSCSLLVE